MTSKLQKAAQQIQGEIRVVIRKEANMAAGAMDLITTGIIRQTRIPDHNLHRGNPIVTSPPTASILLHHMVGNHPHPV
jgi:hypothetical protein